MRRTALAILGIIVSASAYSPSLINVVAPADTLAPSIEASIEHRFSRALDTSTGGGSFFGSANVGLEVRGHLWKGLDASIGYLTDDNEIDLTGRYSRALVSGFLDGAAEVQFFNFDTRVVGRASNSYYLASLAFHPFGDRCFLVVEDGYDGYFLRQTPAAALMVRCADNLYAIGEYFFNHDPNRTPLANSYSLTPEMTANTWSFGIKYTTWGHQFKLIFSNCVFIGSRQASAGATDNKIRLGFAIERLFRLKED